MEENFKILASGYLQCKFIFSMAQNKIKKSFNILFVNLLLVLPLGETKGVALVWFQYHYVNQIEYKFTKHKIRILKVSFKNLRELIVIFLFTEGRPVFQNHYTCIKLVFFFL